MPLSADDYCTRMADMPRARECPVYFGGMPEHCDGCGRPLAHGRHFADCEVPVHGAWGCLCPGCIVQGPVRFAWGHGQLYQRTDGHPPAWLLVAGFPPPDLP